MEWFVLESDLLIVLADEARRCPLAGRLDVLQQYSVNFAEV
jgi:hypothetical protein